MQERDTLLAPVKSYIDRMSANFTNVIKVIADNKIKCDRQGGSVQSLLSK
jgi:predicted nucleic acid-binding Zn ribbon protein